MENKFLILIVFLVVGCSFFKENPDEWNETLVSDFKIKNNDYVEHYRKLASDFVKNSDTSVKRINSNLENYLRKLLSKVIRNNQNFFFENTEKLKFYYIKEKRPVYFSLPSGEFFFSSGLINKYIEHESNLVSFLVYEFIKYEKKVYPRNFTFPKGYITLPLFLSLLRLGIDEKINIHKWAYYLIKRSGFDENGYLTWIQTQNRNYLDFALNLGDNSSIFKEESELKDFIVEKYGHNFDLEVEFNSSSTFYKFLSVLK